MAYRAGAELQNLEMPQRHIGPKYFARFGQASWIGVVKDWYGKPAGTFVTKPDRRYGDMICEVNKLAPETYTQEGKGPLYMDCTEITPADHKYMMHWLAHEGYDAMTDYMQKEGIDFRKHPIEFATYPLRGGGLIVANEKAESSLQGLYAAGDEAYGDISAAATFGYIGGESAAQYTQETKRSSIKKNNPKIKALRRLVDEIRGRENGPEWEEANIALKQTMSDYVGKIRYESLLKQGHAHLKRIRKNTQDTIMARNHHELGRCLEVLNMLEIGELTFLMALNRKETRGLHVRHDYPFTNPTLNQAHIIKRSKGKDILNWKSY
jgi:succinate dehydrogenase/fumarate reductase flavoprotein subunit